ncbi:acetate/propionate family kinase, partial [Xanthomonas citri pv. citri]|nr:acetate/propionate family kinase [Xanthomonas citri pv. citri]
DAIVFTAGMGENDSVLRKMIIDKVKSYKLCLDEESNLANYDDYMLISSKESEIPIYKMRTNEEIVIAKYVKELVNSHN